MEDLFDKQYATHMVIGLFDILMSELSLVVLFYLRGCTTDGQVFRVLATDDGGMPCCLGGVDCHRFIEQCMGHDYGGLSTTRGCIWVCDSFISTGVTSGKRRELRTKKKKKYDECFDTTTGGMDHKLCFAVVERCSPDTAFGTLQSRHIL